MRFCHLIPHRFKLSTEGDVVDQVYVTPRGLLLTNDRGKTRLWEGCIGQVICDKTLTNVLRAKLADPTKWDIPKLAQYLTAWYWRDVCQLPPDRAHLLVTRDPDGEYVVRVTDVYNYVHRRLCPPHMRSFLLRSVRMAMALADDPDIGDDTPEASLPPPPDAYDPDMFGTLCWMVRRLGVL